MNHARCSAAIAALAIAFPGIAASQTSAVSAQSAQVHTRAIVVDSHADTTQRMIYDPKFNLGERYANGNLDIPRMREGGLDAVFFSIWVPSAVTGPLAVKRALDQID